MACPPTVADRDDLESRIEALKEALGDLLWLKELDDGGGTPREAVALWPPAWARARAALDAERPASEKKGKQRNS